MKNYATAQIVSKSRPFGPPDDLVLLYYRFAQGTPILYGRMSVNRIEFGFTIYYTELFNAMHECGLVDFRDLPDSDMVEIWTERQNIFTGEFITDRRHVHPVDYVREYAPHDIKEILAFMWNTPKWRTVFYIPENVAA